jgi:putative adenylate-forming enzyme
VNLAAAYQFVSTFLRAKRLDRVRERGRIEELQRRWLANLLHDVGRDSEFYRAYAGRSLTDWPIIDKQVWMDQFDQINTVHAKLTVVSDIANQAEVTRDFAPTWNGFTVGLSTGTSGARGLFMASRAERAEWAGTLLAKMIDGSIFRRDRVTLVLRAGSNLYDSVGALRLRFTFIDQTWPWNRIVDVLKSSAPTVLAAPARVLRLLADQRVSLRPRRIISVAEVLDELDRRQIEAWFGLPVEQIYQATEGLLGTTCERGLIHLNEPYILIEPEWQDVARTRMIPLITDLRRRSQPVIRYRLNDVLRVHGDPCVCGRASTALDGVDGRRDDVLWLKGTNCSVPIFPDLLARTIVREIPDLSDFEVQELAPGSWRFSIAPLPVSMAIERLIQSCDAMVHKLGAEPPTIEVSGFQPRPLTQKQRRIRGHGSLTCAS